jgi:hypothetical protein
MLKLRTPHISLLALALSVPAFARAQDAASPAPTAPAASAPAAETTPAATTPSSAPAQDEEQAAAEQAASNASEQAAAAGHAFIAHLPVSSAPIDSILLVFDVRGDDLVGEIVVYFRPLDNAMGEVRSVLAGRDEKGMRARLPGHLTEGAGFAYWVVHRAPDGSEQPVFASAEAPYPLHVIVGSVASREHRLLAEHGGRRSRISATGEWVDLGSFEVSGPASKEPDERDHYYALEAQYAYRFFRIIEELEFSLGSLRGKATDTDNQLFDTQRKIGLDYGRAAITYAFGEWFRVRTGLLLGVSTRGFEGGVDGAVVFGDHQGTDFRLYGSYVSHLGGSFGTRLGWATVPRVPMGARVEVTDFPTADEVGVRLLFDAGWQLSDAALIRVIGGYRGRTSLVGGPSLGTELSFSF